MCAENYSLNKLLLTENPTLKYFEDLCSKACYGSIEDILVAHNITLSRIEDREKELDKKLLEIEENIKINSECDKWDYIFAVSAGTLAGLIDSFLVGFPKDSSLLSSSDKLVNHAVEHFARLNGWGGAQGSSNSTKSAIGFLERAFKVNYDHQRGSLVNDFMMMTPSNHHLKSLSHSPSPIGLLFSLIDQFNGTATFIDNGQLITVTSESKLQGGNLPSKVFCAFVNWIGHIMSDVAGSSGASGRGSGIPVPFYELLQTLNIGDFSYGEKKHLADIAVKVFEQGYDLRFGIASSIPVLMVELFVRFFCIVRYRYEQNVSWSECMQFLRRDKNTRLRKMLLAAQGTLCLIDSGDAFIRSGGALNWVGFFSRMNFVAWMRLSYLGLSHAVSILSNEVNIQRYKFRAEALRLYVEDVEEITNQFLFEHNRKMNKFFSDRRKELKYLFCSLENSIHNTDYISAVDNIRSIGNVYGIKSNRLSFEEFNKLIDDDEY